MAAAYQNTTKTLAAALALFCAALLLTAYTKERPAVARFGSGVMAELLRPVQSVHGLLRHGLAGAWERYVDLLGAQRDNLRLQARVAALEEQNARLRETEHENLRLRGLLEMTRAADVRGVAADVIGYDPSNWVQVITIDKGRADGIAAEMPVLEQGGVAGQVISAGRHSARVLLLTDHTSGIDAIVQESRARGVLEGLGRFRCRLSFVAAQEEVKVGDRVITSGMDGIFPKGLVLGIVSKVADRESGKLFQEIEVKSAADFSRLETVVAVTGPRAPAGAEEER